VRPEAALFGAERPRLDAAAHRQECLCHNAYADFFHILCAQAGKSGFISVAEVKVPPQMNILR